MWWLVFLACGGASTSPSTEPVEPSEPPETNPQPSSSTPTSEPTSLTSPETRPPVCAATSKERGTFICEAPGFEQRPYELFLPADYEELTEIPLIMVLHGGSSNAALEMVGLCPGGDLSDSGCLHHLASQEGFAVLYANGTSVAGLGADPRVWAAGGGVSPFRCSSVPTCEDGVDDIPYFKAIISDVVGRAPVDSRRIYATGLSNGGAMVHRLACELSEQIAAVVAVAGANQSTTSHTCAPSRLVPLLQIHGSADPCWVYEGGAPTCPAGQPGLEFVSVQRTLEEWSVLHNCSGEPLATPLPDTTNDGMTSVRYSYQGCDSPVEHIRVQGGGHTWPSGEQYLAKFLIGGVTTDFGSEVIWDFVKEHELP